MHITPEQIAKAYDAASLVYEGKLTSGKAAKELNEKYGLNISSARDFIGQYSSLLRGEVFKRTLSALALEYFLSRIAMDHGKAALDNALIAGWRHVEYYEKIGGALGKFRSVLESFQSELTVPASASLIERNFSAAVDKAYHDSPAARKARLRTASKKPSQTVATTKVFSRNADVVAEVLFRAQGKCELCNKPAPFKKKSNGLPYLEVHHKVWLSNDGEDSVENAIALCPNCHRQQHHG